MTIEDRIERFRKAYEKALACQWKGGPASIVNHLQRRKKRGHLPPDATESDLIQKGMEVLQSAVSTVYEYIPSGTLYFVVHEEWAVFFDEEGLWDTAFPPDVPERYFASTKGYKLLGKLSELIP
ncbi:hypothetical protein L0337_01315 [candidate division KSB1 bacterium]|nr:hypothetical protein [candidate division KSB1 bacterium]